MRCGGMYQCAGMVKTMSVCKLFTRNYSLRSQLPDYMNITAPAQIPHEHASKHENPDNLKNEPNREFRNTTAATGVQHVICETPVRIPMREPPSQGWPEKRDRTLPHLILHQMQETGSCHLDDTAVPALPVECITHNGYDDNKYKTMCDQVSAGHRLREQDPADGLVDQVRQQGSQHDKPVIKMTSDGWNCKACKKEDAQRNPEMTEDEHYMSYNTHTFINVHSPEKYRCGDV